jgi:membrane fusion protein, heavy metal efflux system
MARVWSACQLIVSVALTCAVLAYLVFVPPAAPTPSSAKDDGKPKQVVRTVGPQLIRIEPGSKLESKLQIATVRLTQITTPVLSVTGTVVASLRPGLEKGADYWQFNAPEVLTAFTDWQKATADITFAQTQLTQIKQLADTRIASQEKVVDRLKRVLEATGTQKELDAEQANLIQYKIQGRKEVHEAETAVRLAERAEAATARQLQQAGLEPELLKSATTDIDIVMADVPEGMLTRVKQGQGCSAKFVGLPEEVFVGKVNRIAPVISKERRSLRVLFAISDPKDYLRPGMFAEIGIGTDPRNALLVPAEGVLHVAKSDYVLAEGTEPGVWRVVEVQVGEPQGGAVETVGGVRAGERVVGRGAILLKPEVVKSLLAVRPNGGAGAGR